MGLVTVAADDVDAAVAGLTAEIAKGSPQGLAASKALTTAPILDAFDRARRGADQAVSRAFRLRRGPRRNARFPAEAPAELGQLTHTWDALAAVRANKVCRVRCARRPERSGVAAYACHSTRRCGSNRGVPNRKVVAAHECSVVTTSGKYASDLAVSIRQFRGSEAGSKQCLLDRFRKLSAGRKLLTSGIIRKHLRKVADRGL